MSQTGRRSFAVVAVVGNPRASSKTHTTAEYLAGRLAGELSAGRAGRADIVELAELIDEIFDPKSLRVADAVARVKNADLLVVASPTYKATYTALLKAFLERFGHGELAGLPTVAVMLGGAAIHALAVETHLRPLLIEIGASVPTSGLYVLDTSVDHLDDVVTQWLSADGLEILRRLCR